MKNSACLIWNLRSGAILCAAVLAAAAAPPPAVGALSAGGGYELESSALAAGGAPASGGEYRVKGAAAQLLPGNIGLSDGGDYVNRAGFYNPPHFTWEGGRPAGLSAFSGDIALSLPAGAVDRPRFDITINRDPLNRPLAADPGLINDANSKQEHNEGAWSRLYAGHLGEFAVFDEQDYYRKPLAHRGALTMRYRDADGDGNLDGSSPPVRVDSLRAWTLDEDSRLWVALPAAVLDKAAGTLTLPFGLPGVYAMLGLLDTAVGNVYAYPVPFRPNGPQAGSGAGRTGTEADGITFTNLPQSGEIEIYTLDGRLARRLPIPAHLTLPRLKWDVRTASGDKAASGAYIWRVVSAANSKTGKLMVIW